MPTTRRFAQIPLAISLAIVPLATDAANVLEQVPADALGFVVINQLDTTNQQAEKLLGALQLRFPSPLSLLKAAANIDAGLDRSGDVLLVMLPNSKPGERPQFGIWLPVSDFDAFVASLNGIPADGITAVTAAGEDLLVAEQDGWAVVVDPDQRERLQQLRTATSTAPAQIAAWKTWISKNNITAVLLPRGWHALLAWTTSDSARKEAAIGSPVGDQFGPSNASDDGLQQADTDLWSQARSQIRARLHDTPLLVHWASETEAIACGVRIDEQLNAAAGVRVALGRNMPTPDNNATKADVNPPTLSASGDFVVNGATRLPGNLAGTIAGMYAQQVADELRNDIRVAMDDEVAHRFQAAVKRAGADVTAASVLTRPGENQDGAYSNAFLAVRVGDAESFVERAREVMRLWNEMNQSDDDESRLLFESEVVHFGGRVAIAYTLDMVEAFGAAAIPEVRPTMERMFGPGGKLRLLLVSVDEHTVLLAAATNEQAAPAINSLAQSRPIAWDERTNRFLPRDADWRLMVSPQGYTRWLKRQMDAMLGPVIGAPLVRQFPASPPVGAAGGLASREIWVDLTVPSETVHAAGQYLHQR